MISDAAQIAFGVNSEITLAHVHNVGLTLTHVTAGDNLPVVFQLKSEEDEILANEVLGSIEFAAGDSDGTDGATVAAGIHAIAEGAFSASANATKLVFTTGVSETAASSATAKATLSSIGDFTVAGDLIIKDGGTIGSASDLDAIAIASNGVVTFSQAPVFPDGSIAVADLDIDGATDIGAAIVDADLFIVDDGAGGTNRKTTAARLKTYIQASTAATAADDIGAGDAAVLITTDSGNITIDAAANDTDIILKGTDGTVDTTFLTIDGSAAGSATFNNQIIVGDGKLVLNSTAVSSTAAELNILDGITAVVGELNALDLGSTAVGTAIASKAVILDSNKDYTGIRNLTATTHIGALTGNADTATALETARTIGGTSFDGSANIAVGLAATATALASARTIGGTSFDGTANIAVALAAVATAVTVTDNEDTNENNVLVFVAGADADGGNVGLESDGNLIYNPSTGTLTVPNVSVSGTFTTVNSVTMDANNAVVFEGTSADEHETTLTSIDATGDRTISLPNVSGTLPVLAAASATAITSTPEELNILDGATVVVGEINALDIGSTAVGTAVASKAVILDSSKDYTGIRNLTISGEIDAATGDFSGAVDVAGATTTAAITASGIIKTDDSTAATSTTDGSLQTDGGLSVVLDAVIGDDIIMISDAAQIAFGENSDVTLKHVHNVGLTMTHVGSGDNLPMVLQLKSEEDAITVNEVIGSLEFAAGDSGGTDGATVAAGIHAIAEDTFSASANATKLVFTTGVSETAASSATAKATLSSIGDFQVAGDLVVKDDGLIGSASDLDAIAIASNGVVTFSQIPVMPANSIDSDEYIDGSIDRAHLSADIIDGTKIADDAINSEHYAADSIDEEHIANDAIGAAELKSVVTLLIKNAAGTTLKTVYGAGA